jgi:hypothetical protein
MRRGGGGGGVINVLVLNTIMCSMLRFIAFSPVLPVYDIVYTSGPKEPSKRGLVPIPRLAYIANPGVSSGKLQKTEKKHKTNEGLPRQSGPAQGPIQAGSGDQSRLDREVNPGWIRGSVQPGVKSSLQEGVNVRDSLE